MQEVDTRVSPNDGMFTGSLERYLDVGRSAIEVVERLVGDIKPRKVLDLPSGHGRVTRFLRARYPESELFVSDLNSSGAEFCAEMFSATQLAAASNFDDIDYGHRFDLLFVGSLITHLSMDGTNSFLRLVCRHLSPNGIAVVSLHGAFVAGRIFDRPTALYGLSRAQERSVFQEYISHGYGFSSYPTRTDYGISLISRDWIYDAARTAGLELFTYRDHGWDNHQDVIALRIQTH